MGSKRAARLAGLATSTVDKLLYGAPERGMGPSKRIRRATADALLAVKADLSTLGGRALVDATGTRRRLQALVAIGWSQSKLGRELGMGPGNFGSMLGRGRLYVSTVRAVRDLYDRLWSTGPPEDEHRDKIAANRARNYARARGWAVPQAWDDDTIDDPTAIPEGAAAPDCRKKLPAVDELAWLVKLGETDEALAVRFGASVNSVKQARYRAAS